MASIQQLPVKTLVKVLKDLRGGDIGFDPYRDERTAKKENLLRFILANHTNESIIAAIQKVSEETEVITVDTETSPPKEPIYVRYRDISGGEHTDIFSSEHLAQKFIHENPAYYYLGKMTEKQYILSQTPTLPQVTLPTSDKTSKGVTSFEFVTSVKKKATVTPDAQQTPEANQIAVLLASMAAKSSVDESKVREICDARAQDYVDNILDSVNARLTGYDDKISKLQMPVTVHVLKVEDAKTVDLGIQHKHFSTLLKMAQARTKDGNRLNIWLKGPAGSGKTTAAKKVSEALEQPFQFNGAISTEYELMGFRDAAGNYHTTAFREVFENGGVYLFDEVDSSLPKAVLAFNAALANGECRFPDKMVTRHKDCVILAGANTAGNGASSDYVGRMKQDLAFLNRFVMLDWPLDEALEKALASNKDWVRKVQKFRANADKRGIKGHIISPRATFYGEALLAAGIDEEMVEQAVLRGALTTDQWATLCH